MYWIRSAVKQSQTRQSRIIHIPSRLHETHKKITSAEMKLQKEFDRKPSQMELAQAVDITEAQLDRCVNAIAQKCLSLDADIENTLKPLSSKTSKDSLYDVL